MGNSGSSSNTNGQSTDKQVSSTQEQKSKADEHLQINNEEKEEMDSEMKQDNERLEELLNSVESSLKEDDSTANIVYNYARIRAECPPKFESVGECVKQMKEGWQGILKQLDTIKQYSDYGKKKAATMMNIYYDYWQLLLETRNKIGLLIKQCKIQKKTINELLDIIKLAHEQEGRCPEDDKQAYDECVKMLGKWIDASSIKPLINKWLSMNKRLQSEKDDWYELAKAASAYYSRQTWKFIGKLVFGAVIAVGVIACVAAVVVATCGTAAVGAAAAAGTAVAVETAAGISTAVVVGTAVAVGSAVVVGSVAVGVAKALSYKEQAAILQNDVNGVINRLEKMIGASKKMQDELHKVESCKDEIGIELESYKDVKSYRLMKSGLNGLNESLNKFIQQGNIAMSQIEDAVKQFVQS